MTIWVAIVSNMGAPLVGQERLADSRNIARAVEMQEEFGGFKFRAVMSLEIGGGNGIAAVDGGGAPQAARWSMPT